MGLCRSTGRRRGAGNRRLSGTCFAARLVVQEWYSGLMKLITQWLLSAAALLAVAYLYEGVVVTSFGVALLAAALLGALNLVLRPILILLTLPVTLLTLGLFLFVVNALVFWAAAGLLSGLDVRSFGAALLGSLIYSALQLAIDFVLARLFPD